MNCKCCWSLGNDWEMTWTRGSSWKIEGKLARPACLPHNLWRLQNIICSLKCMGYRCLFKSTSHTLWCSEVQINLNLEISKFFTNGLDHKLGTWIGKAYWSLSPTMLCSKKDIRINWSWKLEGYTHLLFTFQYIIILVKLLRKIIISLPSFLLFRWTNKLCLILHITFIIQLKIIYNVFW